MRLDAAVLAVALSCASASSVCCCLRRSCTARTRDRNRRVSSLVDSAVRIRISGVKMIRIHWPSAEAVGVDELGQKDHGDDHRSANEERKSARLDAERQHRQDQQRAEDRGGAARPGPQQADCNQVDQRYEHGGPGGDIRPAEDERGGGGHCHQDGPQCDGPALGDGDAGDEEHQLGQPDRRRVCTVVVPAPSSDPWRSAEASRPNRGRFRVDQRDCPYDASCADRPDTGLGDLSPGCSGSAACAGPARPIGVG